jgi:hypothetical protein
MKHALSAAFSRTLADVDPMAVGLWFGLWLLTRRVGLGVHGVEPAGARFEAAGDQFGRE